MGEFAVHCMLSGLPISSGDPVVLVPLIHTVYKDSLDKEWLPNGMPVRGFYNNYGDIDDADGNDVPHPIGHWGICHLSLWEELHGWWEKEDDLTSMEDLFKLISEKYEKEMDGYKRIVAESAHLNDPKYTEHWQNYIDNPIQVVYSASYEVKNGVNRWWMISKMFLGHPQKNISEHINSDFENSLYQMIIDKSWNELICYDLETLATVYCTVHWTGRPIMPTDTSYAIQYPDYKKELKWFKIVTKLANTFRKEQIKSEKKSREEQKVWEAKWKKEEEEKKEKLRLQKEEKLAKKE